MVIFIIPFTSHCQCLSEETLKAVGPVSLVSIAFEVCHAYLIGMSME